MLAEFSASIFPHTNTCARSHWLPVAISHANRVRVRESLRRMVLRTPDGLFAHTVSTKIRCDLSIRCKVTTNDTRKFWRPRLKADGYLGPAARTNDRSDPKTGV